MTFPMFQGGILSDEDEPSLGRNRVLRLGACMLKKLLATLYESVAKLLRHCPSKSVIAGWSPVTLSICWYPIEADWTGFVTQ